MGRRSKFHALVALLLFPLAAQAAENWGRLKLGMSVEETIAALGQPLLRTAGRGFETWTYDKGGDVLLYGSVIAWWPYNPTERFYLSIWHRLASSISFG